MNGLPKPNEKALIYEDSRVYACLANFPIAEGHTVVVWKADVSDLHLMPKSDYEYLMDKVDEVRNGMIRALGVEKVYLMYMDEANHVHWHLIPRFDEKGFTVLQHQPTELLDFSPASKIREQLASLK